MAVTSTKMDMVTKYSEAMVKFRDLAESELPRLNGLYVDAGSADGLPTQGELDASAFAGMTVAEFTTAISSIETLLTGLKAVAQYADHINNFAKIRRTV